MTPRPPRSTRTDTLFPYTTPSDLAVRVRKRRHRILVFDAILRVARAQRQRKRITDFIGRLAVDRLRTRHLDEMLLRIDARYRLGWIEQSRSDRIGGPDRRIEGLAGEEIVDELEIGFGVVRIDILPAIISARSEEHKSVLQSLRRISSD